MVPDVLRLLHNHSEANVNTDYFDDYASDDPVTISKLIFITSFLHMLGDIKHVILRACLGTK
jgi:hypothetical protein